MLQWPGQHKHIILHYTEMIFNLQYICHIWLGESFNVFAQQMKYLKYSD